MKALIGGSLTSISDQLANNSNSNKINEIATAVTALHEQIGARLEKIEHEVSLSFSVKKVVLFCLIFHLRDNAFAVWV